MIDVFVIIIEAGAYRTQVTDSSTEPHQSIVAPPRTPWSDGFPDVVIHTTVALRDAHPRYASAKAGDPDEIDPVEALSLSQDLLSHESISHLQFLLGGRSAILLPVTALEITGINAIPDAMAQIIADELNWQVSLGDVVQTNRVGHTRARAFNRLVTPAAFEGRVMAGADYVLVDDHVGLGGTLANLKGFVETHGARVVAMTTLTESREARQIALRPLVLDMLKDRHGEGLENLWRGQFGHGLDRLTNVEAGILHREPSLESIRDRLAQAAVEARQRGLAPWFDSGHNT